MNGCPLAAVRVDAIFIKLCNYTGSCDALYFAVHVTCAYLGSAGRSGNGCDQTMGRIVIPGYKPVLISCAVQASGNIIPGDGAQTQASRADCYGCIASRRISPMDIGGCDISCICLLYICYNTVQIIIGIMVGDSLDIYLKLFVTAAPEAFDSGSV